MNSDSESKAPSEAQLLSLAAELGLITQALDAAIISQSPEEPVHERVFSSPEKSFRELT